MNKYLVKSPPVLIDEEILQEAVLQHLSQDQARRIAKEEGIVFSEILKLHLDYRSEITFY